MPDQGAGQAVDDVDSACLWRAVTLHVDTTAEDITHACEAFRREHG